MKKLVVILCIVVVGLIFTGCVDTKSSDYVQSKQQETMLKEATKQTGMPAIKNFRERKLLKDILELRDQEGLTTYTYIIAEQTGKLIFLGESVGYGIPYATQYTSPEKVYRYGDNSVSDITVPQADPNGLFSPASAEGTWVILKDKNSDKTSVVYVEPRIVVSPFQLSTD